MSVLRVTTFRGLGVGDWSFYPGSAQKLVSKPMGLVIAELVGDPPEAVMPQQQTQVPVIGAHQSDGRVSAEVERRVAQITGGEHNARHDLGPPPCQPSDEVVDFLSGKRGDVHE